MMIRLPTTTIYHGDGGGHDRDGNDDDENGIDGDDDGDAGDNDEFFLGIRVALNIFVIFVALALGFSLCSARRPASRASKK